MTNGFMPSPGPIFAQCYNRTLKMAMYRLKNFLFGWDYIQWRNSSDQGISRVIRLSDGRVVYWRYRSLCLPDEITSPDQVFWLTCSPSKFGFKTKKSSQSK